MSHPKGDKGGGWAPPITARGRGGGQIRLMCPFKTTVLISKSWGVTAYPTTSIRVCILNKCAWDRDSISISLSYCICGKYFPIPS